MGGCERRLPSLRESIVGVIGLGYVGLPLAVALKEELVKHGGEVRGFDKNPRRVEELQQGIDRTREVNRERLVSCEIKVSCDETTLDGCNVFIIAVPTPVDDMNHPDLRYLEAAACTVGMSLKRRKRREIRPIVIFESTVYPGATEEVCIPCLENESGEICGTGFTVGYSPERVNPGDKVHTLDNVVKIVSGVDHETAKWVEVFYKQIAKQGVYIASSIRVAEAAKLVENIQRDLNIALVNEFARVFWEMGINTSEVLDAAATKWNFARYSPGLVGGHCIGVDPFYLTYKAQACGYYPELILAGRRMNDTMGRWIAEKGIQLLLKKGVPEIRNKVYCLVAGVTYKADCPDIRNTKVVSIKNALESYGIEVDMLDPVADGEEFAREYGLVLKQKTELRKDYSLIIIAVAHKEFSDEEQYKWKDCGVKELVVLDVKNILSNNGHIVKL